MEQRYQSSGIFVKYITDESSAIDFVKATSWKNQYVYTISNNWKKKLVLMSPNAKQRN